MKSLFKIGNQYVKQSDWKDLALIKCCLCAMGVVIGTHVAPKHKKTVAWSSAGVFVATYIPLMAKFFKVVGES